MWLNILAFFLTMVATAALRAAVWAWWFTFTFPGQVCAFCAVSAVVYYRAHRIVWTAREEAAFAALDHPDFAQAANYTPEHVCMYCLRAHEYTANSPEGSPSKEDKVVVNVPALRCYYHRRAAPDLDVVLPLNALKCCSMHAHKSLYSAGGGKSTITPFDVKAGATSKPLMVYDGVNNTRMLTLFPVARVIAHLVHFAGHTVLDVQSIGIRAMAATTIPDPTPVPPWWVTICFWKATVIYNWFRVVQIVTTVNVIRGRCSVNRVGSCAWRARAYLAWLRHWDAADRRGADPEYDGDVELGGAMPPHRQEWRGLMLPLLGSGSSVPGSAQVESSGTAPSTGATEYFDISSAGSDGDEPDDAPNEQGGGDGPPPPPPPPAEPQGEAGVPTVVCLAALLAPPPGLGAQVAATDSCACAAGPNDGDERTVEYYECNEAVLGSVYEFIAKEGEREGWRTSPLEPSYTIRRKLDSRARVREAVAAGEPLAESLDRHNVQAQARVVVPLDRAKTLYIADPTARSNIDKAIYERHFPDTKPVRFHDRQLGHLKDVAGRLGSMLGELSHRDAYQQCLDDMMPKKWSPALKLRAKTMLCNLDLKKDDSGAARQIRKFFVKHNESLSKAKPRGILAEPSESIVLLHAMLAVTIEASFKATGLKWRTLKGATPEQLNKRIRKLLGAIPAEWKAVSADFGKFDSSLRDPIRQATEVEFCRAFVEAAGLKDAVFEKLRDADRAKQELNFSTLFERVSTRLFGRGSGDRLTATGNLFDNLIAHVAFYKSCGYDWEALLVQLISEIEAEVEREIELLLEGDDNAPMFKESVLQKMGMADWDDFLRAYKDWFEGLNMEWEPMRDDSNIAATGAEAFRCATDRLEFVSRHFFVHGNFVGSFPKLTKALSTCRVSFSTTTDVNVGASMFESARALSYHCPVLYKVQTALQRYHDTHGKGTRRHEGYIGVQMEWLRKAEKDASLGQCIERMRARAMQHDDAAREYIARNYPALPLEKQRELELRAEGCKEWHDLGALFNELDDLARMTVPARV